MPQITKRLVGNAKQRNFKQKNESFDSLNENKNHILKLNSIKKNLSSTPEQHKIIEHLFSFPEGRRIFKFMTSSQEKYETLKYIINFPEGRVIFEYLISAPKYREFLKKIVITSKGRNTLTHMVSSPTCRSALKSLISFSSGRKILENGDLAIINSFIRNKKRIEKNRLK